MITQYRFTYYTALCLIFFSVNGIYKGYDIRIEKAPYQVNYGDICGAVIVHRQWALTTAHCGIEKDFIRVGSRRRLGGAKVNVSGHLVHPRYGKKHEFDYDVLLLQLRRMLHFSQKISMIQFSGGECGDTIAVTGWGYPAEKGNYQNILQQVRVDMVPKHKCQVIDQFWYNHTLTPRMFCAGGEDGDACQVVEHNILSHHISQNAIIPSDPTEVDNALATLRMLRGSMGDEIAYHRMNRLLGDSGGAAVSFGRLVGLSSFGYGCGRNIPGVYTNLTAPSIRIWIKRYVPQDKH